MTDQKTTIDPNTVEIGWPAGTWQVGDTVFGPIHPNIRFRYFQIDFSKVETIKQLALALHMQETCAVVNLYNSPYYYVLAEAASVFQHLIDSDVVVELIFERHPPQTLPPF